jgi:formate hydrogenlyase subunit 3/multisubunit Na+/H+ antiporter MnhD subunit
MANDLEPPVMRPPKSTPDRPTLRTSAGIWIWGAALTILIVAIFVSFCFASYHVEPDGKWENKNHEFIAGLYAVIRTNGTVVAALVAVLGVIWSWFYQMSYGKSASRERERMAEEDGDAESSATPRDSLNPQA